MSSDLLKTASDAGGWVFAAVTISVGAFFVIRWLVAVNARLAAALDKLSDSLDALRDEMRAIRVWRR